MKALITGISGQDGAYLAQHLLERGWSVVGATRQNASATNWRLEELGIAQDIEYVSFDLLDSGSVERVIRQTLPDHVYNLAAQSFVGASFQVPNYTFKANALGPLRILEALRQYAPDARFYQASTSEMFGGARPPQDEHTPFYPKSPYGVAKAAAHHLTVNFRESFGLHASSGILFNHESPLRGREFVTRKIAAAVPRFITHGQPLFLGNLDAQRDWGYAPEYVAGMHQMLLQEEAGDYVLATGKTCSVRTFVELCFISQGLVIDWQGAGAQEQGFIDGRLAVQVDPHFYRPAEVWKLRGDASKAAQHLGWRPRVLAPRLAEVMVNAEMRRAAAPVLEVA